MSNVFIDGMIYRSSSRDHYRKTKVNDLVNETNLVHNILSIFRQFYL